MALSDYADWWDKQHKESQRYLEEWVQENPQWWAIGLATAMATAMELGAGTVDALRFGEGIAEGGVKGVGKDAIRLLVILGPLGRVGGALSRVGHTQAIRLAKMTTGVTGPCTFTAVNNALTATRGLGANFFLTARDAARALGRSLSSVGTLGGKYKLAAWIDDLVPFLIRQGVRLKNLGIPKTLQDIEKAAQANDGAVIFAIEWTDLAGKIHRHSMIAFRTLGGVKFADYGGKFMRSLVDLGTRGGIWQAKNGYHVISAGQKGSAVLIEGLEVTGSVERYALDVFKGGMLLLEGVHAIETVEGVDLAFPVTSTAAIEQGLHEEEVVKASFEAFKERKSGRPIMRLPPLRIKGRRNGLPDASLLTGVQYRLNALGFGAGPVDGLFGPRTKRAVMAFQKNYPPLKCDCIPGPITQKKLVEVCGF